MQIRFWLIVGASFWAGSPLWALPVDFTPRSYEHATDGGIWHGFQFIHGKQKVVFLPPGGWTWTGNAEKISLRPAESTNTARAEITHTEGTPSDQAGVNALFQCAQALLPPLAQGVQLVDLNQNPIFIDGRSTVRFVFTGQLFGQSYKFSVVLLPLDGEQFGFVFYSEKKDYEAAATAWMGSLSSLHWQKAEP